MPLESGASASIPEQTTGGLTVVVDEVPVPDGGFVTVHGGIGLNRDDATRDDSGGSGAVVAVLAVVRSVLVARFQT